MQGSDSKSFCTNERGDIKMRPRKFCYSVWIGIKFKTVTYVDGQENNHVVLANTLPFFNC